jgi:transposase-like protein
MAKRTRKRYSQEQKRNILAAAQKDGLTALQVQKKFGVTPVTYYSWRKKSGVARRRGRPAGVATGARGDLASVVRGQVQSRVRSMLPDIVRAEVNSYLDSLLGSKGARRRGRRKKK